jgi:hypothetical protein
MRAYPELYRALTVRRSDMIRDFKSATARPPWDGLVDPERNNFPLSLLGPLLRLTLLTPGSPTLCRKALVVSVSHGERRREQGCSEDILIQDFDELGRIVVTRLAKFDLETPETEAFRRIEGMLSVSYFASLRGYHRQAYEAQGLWPQTLTGMGGALRVYCH